MIPDETDDNGNARVSIGDNSGSFFDAARADQREALFDTPRDGGKTFAQRRDEFLASAAAQKVRDRQSAADAGDTIKLAREVWEAIDADRRQRSDPFRETHLSLSAMATEFWEPVSEAMRGLLEQISAYTADEDSRVAASRREQEQEMARWRGEEAPAPAPRHHIDYSAPAPEPQRVAPAMREPKAHKIRGELGATISRREIAQYEIEDISLLPDHIMQAPLVRDAILETVRRTAKMLGVPKGIRVITNTTTQIS